MKILVGVPRNDYFTIPARFAECLLYAIDYTKEKFGSENVGFTFSQSTVIAYNRNFLFKEARKKDVDIMVMIDSDMTFKKEAIVELVESLEGADMACGIYFQGAPPYHPSIYQKGKEAFVIYDDYPKDARFEIECSGMAFNAFGRRPIYGMETDPFENITKNGMTYGEDMSFCLRARERDFKLICDSRIKVGHLRMSEINENYRPVSNGK